MHPLEARIGYKFRNSLLLAEALTHSSLGHETQQVHFDNQRLEYLGDAVLQLLFSEYLYRRFTEAAEGHLTKSRARLVSGEALAVYAQNISLGEHLMMGRGDESSGGRRRASTLADAFEALVGAIYLDGGLGAARSFVLTQAREPLSTVHQQPPLEINPKGRLQEILQALPPAPGGDAATRATRPTASSRNPARTTRNASPRRWTGTTSRSVAARVPASSRRKVPPPSTPCVPNSGPPLLPRPPIRRTSLPRSVNLRRAAGTPRGSMIVSKSG